MLEPVNLLPQKPMKDGKYDPCQFQHSVLQLCGIRHMYKHACIVQVPLYLRIYVRPSLYLEFD